MTKAEANRKAKDVQQVESRTLESIDKLRSTFNVGSSSTSILEKNYPELLREIQSIGSDLRYLSPLPGRTAHELEMKIQVEMEILFDALRCGSGTDLELQIKQIRESANKICDFIKVRKECKNNQDLQEM